MKVESRKFLDKDQSSISIYACQVVKLRGLIVGSKNFNFFICLIDRYLL